MLSYPVYRLAISLVCIVLAVALYYLIRRTRLGMMIRAGNDDRGMVESLGINIDMIYRVVFALGVAMAALAGMLAAPISSVFPNMGRCLPASPSPGSSVGVRSTIRLRSLRRISTAILASARRWSSAG